MAKNVIARLNIDLVARTAQLTKGLKNAKASLGGFKRFAITALKGFAVAAGAATAAVGGMALAIQRFVAPAFDAIDVLAKASAKLGTTTNELLGLQFAAGQFSGVEGPALNMAIQRFTRRLAQAAQGGGELLPVLQRLGLDAERLVRMSPAKAFLELADATAKVQNPADRLLIAFKAFDSEGAALSTTLAQGSKNIRAMMDDLRALGLTVSEEGAVKVQAANDAMDRFGRIIQVIPVVRSPPPPPIPPRRPQNTLRRGRCCLKSTQGQRPANSP